MCREYKNSKIYFPETVLFLLNLKWRFVRGPNNTSTIKLGLTKCLLNILVTMLFFNPLYDLPGNCIISSRKILKISVQTTNRSTLPHYSLKELCRDRNK